MSFRADSKQGLQNVLMIYHFLPSQSHVGFFFYCLGTQLKYNIFCKTSAHAVNNRFFTGTRSCMNFTCKKEKEKEG